MPTQARRTAPELPGHLLAVVVVGLPLLQVGELSILLLVVAGVVVLAKIW